MRVDASKIGEGAGGGGVGGEEQEESEVLKPCDFPVFPRQLKSKRDIVRTALA